MKALVVILVALSLVYAQNTAAPWSPWTAFTCNFICTSPQQFGSGYFTGQITYDWSVSAMQINIPASNYQEFYQFNPNRGYNVGDPLGQFAYQYMYKSSDLCPCETTGLNYSMPALFPQSCEPSSMNAISNLAYWLTPGKPDTTTFPGTSCNKYTANDQFYVTTSSGQIKSYVLSSFFWTSNGQPAGFNINDLQRRTFQFTSCTAGTPGSMNLIAPSKGCSCGKQMDIVLTLDRSGSISYNQWLLEYQFVQNLVGAFSIGSLTANIGICNWNAAQWVTIPLTSGTDAVTVNNAVASMTCCPGGGASSGSCCCCGTPIGGGMWLGCNLLAASTRARAQKVLILLTDGCQNHLWDDTANPPTAIACACASEKACASNATCVADISKYYQWCETNVPGTKVIVVGVGGSDTICTDQLLVAAGGDPTNVFNPSSWAQLQSLVQTITATACTPDNTPCPGCCGICTCGQCIPPSQCRNPNNCTVGVLDSTGACCTTQPVQCPTAPCKYTSCDPIKGCQLSDIQCPLDDINNCLHYSCNNTATCQPSKITNLPQCKSVVVDLCANASLCNDNNACTQDSCNSTTGCVYTYTCPKSDKCTNWICLTSQGCKANLLNCNDNNACTNDTCDPLTGCKHTNITCAKPTDPCKLSTCDTISGCVITNLDCATIISKGNCSFPACNSSNPTQVCYLQPYNCTVPGPTSAESFPQYKVVLVSTLTTAALAGIIVACVLLFAGLGGGAAVAVIQAGAGGPAMVIASNPLYAGVGTGGDNPLNKC